MKQTLKATAAVRGTPQKALQESGNLLKEVWNK